MEEKSSWGDDGSLYAIRKRTRSLRIKKKFFPVKKKKKDKDPQLKENALNISPIKRTCKTVNKDLG